MILSVLHLLSFVFVGQCKGGMLGYLTRRFIWCWTLFLGKAVPVNDSFSGLLSFKVAAKCYVHILFDDASKLKTLLRLQ